MMSKIQAERMQILKKIEISLNKLRKMPEEFDKLNNDFVNEVRRLI